MDIHNIIRSIDSQHYTITDHADQRTQSRQLDIEDVLHSVRNGEIIQSYPQDRPHPSYLIYGKDRTGEPVHSVWAYDEQSEQATLIAVYRPNPAIWINGRERRKSDGDV